MQTKLSQKEIDGLRIALEEDTLAEPLLSWAKDIIAKEDAKSKTFVIDVDAVVTVKHKVSAENYEDALAIAIERTKKNLDTAVKRTAITGFNIIVGDIEDDITMLVDANEDLAAEGDNSETPESEAA